jgi:cellulose synthase (UDP-forming)
MYEAWRESFQQKNCSQYQTASGLFQPHSKHGNYNAWLYSMGFDRYDIIAAFDPDHVPQRDFLARVLGYFEDPNIGYVQVAQAYFNQRASFIARGAAEETYAYYSSVQMASYGMGYPIIVGSHNTHRVIALKQVGGFAPHDADDLMITLLYRDKGWKGVYVPEILARGLTPIDWNGYLTQQRCWARSVLDLKFRYYPKIAGHLCFKTRLMGFLHGLNYIHRSVLIFIGLLTLISLLLTGTSPAAFSFDTIKRLLILYGALLIGEFYRQRFYLDWKNERGLHWRSGILQLAKWPYTLIAFFEAIFNIKMPYQLTYKLKKQSGQLKLLLPHLIVVTSLFVSLIINIFFLEILHPIIYVLVFIFMIGSLFTIATSKINFPDPFNKKLFKSHF